MLTFFLLQVMVFVLPHQRDVMILYWVANVCQHYRATIVNLVKMANADVRIVTTLTTAPAYVRT